MTSVLLSGVSSGSSQQSAKLALLSKLFQTTGNSEEGGRNRRAADPVAPPPPHPSQANSAAGLASMFKALQNEDTSSVSDLLSRMLQAVDSDGDGEISSDELLAVTELTTGKVSNASSSALVRIEDMPRRPTLDRALDLAPAADAKVSALAGPVVLPTNPFVALMQKQADLLPPGPDLAATNELAAVKPPISAYEALFQSLQVVFAQSNGASATNSGQRYTDLLRSLARAV